MANEVMSSPDDNVDTNLSNGVMESGHNDDKTEQSTPDPAVEESETCLDALQSTSDESELPREEEQQEQEEQMQEQEEEEEGEEDHPLPANEESGSDGPIDSCPVQEEPVDKETPKSSPLQQNHSEDGDPGVEDEKEGQPDEPSADTPDTDAQVQETGDADSPPLENNAVPETSDQETASSDDVDLLNKEEPPVAGEEEESNESEEVGVDSSHKSVADDPTLFPDPASQVLIAELEANLQLVTAQRDTEQKRARRAEKQAEEFDLVLAQKLELEGQYQAVSQALSRVSADKSALEVELTKLREARDEHERKEIVLSNRLNAARKKEAAKANLSEQLDDSLKAVREELEDTQEKLKDMTRQKQESEERREQETANLEKRIENLLIQLQEEKRLNEERKKKMKAYVEAKQEEIREAKQMSEELNGELSQTNRSLREHHSRWKQLHAQWVQSQTRNRELQRDLNRTKKESESMHKMGNQMNLKLSQSAQQTEEHKNKRLTAKQELMNVLTTLESERDVSRKLRDSIKFTFMPKALSQQQLIRDSLKDFEYELTRLSGRLGIALPVIESNDELFQLPSEDDDDQEPSSPSSGKKSRSEIDSSHLLSDLEDETQRVSQQIMILGTKIEQLHVLIDQSGDRSCVDVLSDIMSNVSAAAAGEGQTNNRGFGRAYGQVPTTG